MAELSVIPGGLNGYAAQLSRAAETGRNGSRYIDAWVQLPGWSEGSIIKVFTGNHDRACNAVRGSVSNIATLADASSKQLDLGAKYYTNADRKAAQRADATLPDFPIKTPPQIPEKESATPFQDAVDAERFLEPPEAPEMSEMAKVINNPASIYEYFSPTNIVIQTLKYLGIPDPVEDFTKAFVGNWEQVHQAGTAIGNLGEMINAIGQNVQHGNVALSQAWSGMVEDIQLFSGIPSSVGETRMLREMLERLERGSGGDILREMAADVLAGRVALRSAVGASCYADALEAGVARFAQWYESLSPAEIVGLVDETARLMDANES